MEDMKADMTGAAVVAAAMQAVARLNLPVNLVGYLAFTENMTGGRAMKLGDVLTHRNGKTVEVLNTDAEGRLILADALSFAVEKRPDRLIDLATLTGACMVALGTKIAGLFSQRRCLLPGVPRGHAADRRTRLAPAARRGLQGGAQEPGRRPEERRREVGRGHHRGQVPRAIRGDDAVDSPRHRRPELGRVRQRHPATSGATGCFVRTLVRFIERMAESEVSRPTVASRAADRQREARRRCGDRSGTRSADC